MERKACFTKTRLHYFTNKCLLFFSQVAIPCSAFGVFSQLKPPQQPSHGEFAGDLLTACTKPQLRQAGCKTAPEIFTATESLLDTLEKK